MTTYVKSLRRSPAWSATHGARNLKTRPIFNLQIVRQKSSADVTFKRISPSEELYFIPWILGRYVAGAH